MSAEIVVRGLTVVQSSRPPLRPLWGHLPQVGEEARGVLVVGGLRGGPSVT